MFKTLKAKFATTCKRCGTAIEVGDTMRYGGRGRTYHLKAECPAATDTPELVGAAADHKMAAANDDRYVSHIARFSDGSEYYVNKNGRCEDAPCCGCCS